MFQGCIIDALVLHHAQTDQLSRDKICQIESGANAGAE